jgi:hypothetical protein
MIAYIIHVLCSCVAFACRVLGRYRHVGEKRPCARCEGSGRGWRSGDLDTTPATHVLHAAEKAERLAPHVRNFGCAIPEAILEIDITDEIPDTLRNDGQPDTEREPTTRRRDGAS